MNRNDRSPLASLWDLDPDVAFLNHGSFGACPREIAAHQTGLRERLEREPVQFLSRELPERLARAREAVGRFVGADPEGIVFLPNATTAVNTVVAGLPFAPGDELLMTDHVYPACRNALRHVAARAGARVVEAKVPFPLREEDEIVSAVMASVTPRTRLALVDHVTSPTALVFPIERIVRLLRERGIETLVDGAHAIGMLPLELERIGAAYYTSNAHKWLCAPKGAAFLHVRKDRREGLHPLVISHGFAAPLNGQSRFRAEFDWTGTSDPTPYLTIPEAIRFLADQVPGGWPEIMRRNHALAVAGRERLLEVLGGESPAPGSLVGSTASVLLPAPAPGSPARTRKGDELSALLFERRKIEVSFHPWPGPAGQLVRLSAQLYNAPAEYERLAGALRELLAGTL